MVDLAHHRQLYRFMNTCFDDRIKIGIKLHIVSLMKLFEQMGQKHIFVYDLEFIGDVNVTKSCQIWDISILHVNTGETFTTLIDPDPTCVNFPPPVVEGLFELTRTFLDEGQALPFNIIWQRVVSWVERRVFGQQSVFISHNNFSSDKPVLENHMFQYQTIIPPNWFFFDSLHFFRDNIKSMDYSLKGLVQLLLKENHTGAHRAEADTQKLYQCLKFFTNGQFELNGPCYPAYMSSLRKLKGVGASVESILWSKGYSCEEYLLNAVSRSIQMGNLKGKTPKQSAEEFIYSTLGGENIPLNNVNIIVQSLLFCYIGANTFNDVFN